MMPTLRAVLRKAANSGSRKAVSSLRTPPPPTTKFVVLASLLLCASSSTTIAFTSPASSKSFHTTTAINMVNTGSGSSVDNEIKQWALESGYGDVTQLDYAGSSGWASFRKVSVENPPRPDVKFFVKTSNRSAKEMFEGEALGLRAMFEASQAYDKEKGTTDAVQLRIPEVFYWGDTANGGSFLVMEYLNLGGRSNDKELGRAMAKMHLADPTKLPEAGNVEGKFGFNVDNTIGGTEQPNPWTAGGTNEDWIEFFSKYRIEHQLELAGDSYLLDLFKEKIKPRLHLLFDDIEVKPSLLHGDLWSGNIGSADGAPSIFDPAVYWGHHEAEWGMDWCASLGASFWEGYREFIPRDENFGARKDLYDSYHQLNHYNLFGGGYLSSARGQLERVKKSLDQLEKEK